MRAFFCVDECQPIYTLRMCGRFNDHLPKMHGWAKLLQQWPEYRASYNRAPTESIVSFADVAGKSMRWGMIPAWSKSFDSKYATFNARIESVADKPTFRNAWKHKQHCLIPMAGYYEWVGTRGNKQPFYIRSSDESLLVAAGLYDLWGESKQLSCTMLTEPATDELVAIHPRQPVLMNLVQATSWLQGDQSLIGLERPSVVYHPVSSRVGNVRNNDSSLVSPLDL